jgi:predicted metalloprotease
VSVCPVIPLDPATSTARLDGASSARRYIVIMRLDNGRMSGNVIDRRGSGGKVALGGGAALIVAVVAMLFGVDPGVVMDNMNAGAPTNDMETPANPNDPSAIFVSKVLATTEDAWTEQLGKYNTTYREPELVLFRGAVQSACGNATAAVGPFYCPPDKRAYLDLDFFDTMEKQLGAAGDFAQAYVIAHEIGHHIQNLAGTSDNISRRTGAESDAVRLELQADCYAGVWGAYAQKKGILEIGDVDEAMRAAQAIGDDTLQRKGRGRVTPETFSHGTSAQRARWFKRGLESGDMHSCDTFSAREL